MGNPILIKNYVAASDIGSSRLVAWGSSDGHVVLAGAGDVAIGNSTDLGASTGERVDVERMGIGEVVLGGTVARGDSLVAGSSGSAVATAVEDAPIVGWAEESGVSGDVIRYLISPSIR